MVRVKMMRPKEAALEYRAWCQDAREHYDVPKRVQLVIRAVFDGQIAISDLLSH